MPPTAIDLEQWWSTHGADSLNQLVCNEDLAYQSRHCDFVSTLQSRLCAFDNDQSLRCSFTDAFQIGISHADRYFYANPRRSLAVTLQYAFRDPAAEGMQFDLAMEGLACLDTVERHRVHLFEESKQRYGLLGHDEIKMLLLEELHNAATLHYGQCHLGFRACVIPPYALSSCLQRLTLNSCRYSYNTF